jgi:serine/threonine protein kinase
VSAADPFGLIGQVLDAQFRVDYYVGEGGFSVVYRGTHLGLAEPIAIKCLKLPAALGSALVDSFMRRFRDESRICYKLSQGNLHVVRAIASGTTVSPRTSAFVPYSVLEWLEGGSLADDLAERRSRGLKGRNLEEVVALLDTAMDAVAYAHSQGVVHRDLNPGNLFLAKTSAGTKLKVLDFGVAKIMTDSALSMPASARTLGNVRMFAPAYGAPEQFDDRLGAISPATDVYTLAIVAVEVLGDRAIREGEYLGEFATKALDASARPTPRALGLTVGDAVEDVFSRAVSLTPGERPRDAGELWGQVKHAMRVDAAEAADAAAPTPRHLVEEPAPHTARMPQHAASMVSTLRIERPRSGPRSASEALLATPFPSYSPPAAPNPLVREDSGYGPPPEPFGAVRGAPSFASAPAPAYAPSPAYAPAPAPAPAYGPPPAPSSSGLALETSPSLPLPRSRTPVVFLVVALFLLAGAGAGAWLYVTHHHQEAR